MVRRNFWPWPLIALLALPASACRTATGQVPTATNEADLGPGVSLTIYNQNFAVVKERREMELPGGTGFVRFPNVAATIVPETVQFAALRPVAARVLEQNYEFDLVSAGKLLDKYIDHTISLVDRDGRQIDGKLLASDDAQLILANDDGVQLIPRQNNVRDIRFSKLPDGLLTRPTLVWKVDSAQAGKHLVRVAYRADNIVWRVDYRAVASADESTLDLSGWVTVTNQTGTMYRDANLKLMAGDVHLDPMDRRSVLQGVNRAVVSLYDRNEARKEFQEKTFSEYHLYTLNEPTTLLNAQTKQIELVNVAGVPVTKRYVYRPDFGTRIAVWLEFKNSTKTRTGLGIPLPKGPFRIYQRDVDGQPEFIGKHNIDHTAKEELVRLRTGFAFDLVADRKQQRIRRNDVDRQEFQEWRIRMRNHTDKNVIVTVNERVDGNRNWELLELKRKWEKVDFRTIRFDVDLPADSETVLDYTIKYSW